MAIAVQICVLTALGDVPKKAFDAEMLFDPFEEQFDLPTLTIDGGDHVRRDLKVVGEEDESLVDIGGVKTDAAKQGGECLLGVLAGEDDGLITADTRGAINGMGQAAAKLKVVFRPENKVGKRLM